MDFRSLACRVFGHAVDNHTFARGRAEHRRCLSCGVEYLGRGGDLTRVRHTLSCFLGHHTYRWAAARHRHNEYVCAQCGHPLLFEAGSDPYRRARSFTKRVRYLCGLTGHRVHVVCRRQGMTEYACGCGHSFLLPAGLQRIRHPAVCVAGGHRVAFLQSRAGYDEFRCGDCGHTFAFLGPATRREDAGAGATRSRSARTAPSRDEVRA
jgi:predicted RNA-binding Zn-ribbon protein involved in translation (DUF1610 family)